VTRTFTGLEPKRIRENLQVVRERIASAGRNPADVEVLVATKYVSAEELPALADAGVTLVGENRAQDLASKHALHGDLFDWDFIGALQSRKVKQIVPIVRVIHTVASDSALAQLAKYPAREILVQVNVAGEEGKAGIAPDALGEFVAASPVPVSGLMTMPPFTERAEDSRRHFARLAELAAEHGLTRLSMGTTQDYTVAVAEGATVIRLGSALLS
jgi:uncharacterized pyridoxal phosphate-containing UPF0001 family protein